jgi:predicted molibdopterin-dependent oxidoreductase YjgC
MHPDDAEKRGVQDGGRLRVKTEAGELDLPVRITRDVAAGAIFVPFNQPGSKANAVLAGGFIEPASAEAVEADPAEASSSEPVGHKEEASSSESVGHREVASSSEAVGHRKEVAS